MGNPLQSMPINAAPFVRLELFLFHHTVHPLRSLFFHYEPPPFPNLDSIPSHLLYQLEVVSWHFPGGYVSILIGCCFAWRIVSHALIKTVDFLYLSALHPACIPPSFSMLSVIYLQPEKKCMYHIS